MRSDLRGRCERRVSGDERAEKRCRPAQPRSVKRLAQKQSGIDRQKNSAHARAMGSDLRGPGNGASAGTSARNNVPDLHSNVASTDWRKKSQASAGKERLHAQWRVPADLLRARERRSDGFNSRKKAEEVHGCRLQLASTAELGCGISAARISAVSLATVES